MKIKSLFLIIFFFNTICGFSQEFNSFYGRITTAVSYDSVLKSLQKLEYLGNKGLSSVGLKNTADWLVNQYTSFGYTNIQRDTFFIQGNELYNLIVTKQGTLFPDEYIILCGHYDTWPGKGVNDNGSGVAIILEVARLLSQIHTEYSIRFINFSAEEAGLLGSEHYVSQIVVPQTQNIKLLFNIDEVGGVAGIENNIIRCERDESSPTSNNAASWQYTDSIVVLTHLYSLLNTEITHAYGSDYMPFQDANYVISGFYEKNESSVVHSENDDLAHLDTSYVVEIARASAAVCLYFGKAFNQSYVSLLIKNKDYILYPNPFDSILNIETNQNSTIIFYDSYGKVMARYSLVPGINIIRPASKISGVLNYQIINSEGSTVFAGKLIRMK